MFLYEEDICRGLNILYPDKTIVYLLFITLQDADLSYCSAPWR